MIILRSRLSQQVRSRPAPISFSIDSRHCDEPWHRDFCGGSAAVYHTRNHIPYCGTPFRWFGFGRRWSNAAGEINGNNHDQL